MYLPSHCSLTATNCIIGGKYKFAATRSGPLGFRFTTKYYLQPEAVSKINPIKNPKNNFFIIYYSNYKPTLKPMLKPVGFEKLPKSIPTPPAPFTAAVLPLATGSKPV